MWQKINSMIASTGKYSLLQLEGGFETCSEYLESLEFFQPRCQIKKKIKKL